MRESILLQKAKLLFKRGGGGYEGLLLGEENHYYWVFAIIGCFRLDL